MGLSSYMYIYIQPIQVRVNRRRICRRRVFCAALSCANTRFMSRARSTSLVRRARSIDPKKASSHYERAK